MREPNEYQVIMCLKGSKKVIHNYLDEHNAKMLTQAYKNTEGNHYDYEPQEYHLTPQVDLTNEIINDIKSNCMTNEELLRVLLERQTSFYQSIKSVFKET